MTSTFPSVKFGLMVGIGGGVLLAVRLRDVVVSTLADGFGGWDLSRAEQGDTFKRTGALDGPPSALRTVLTNLEITAMYGRWVHSESQFPFPCCVTPLSTFPFS